MTTVAEQIEAFDPAEFDHQGTPKLNGEKATTIQLSFEAFDLDHTDEEHMLLAERLEQGGNLELTVIAKLTKRTWGERPEADKDRVSRRYTLAIKDIGT